MTPLLVNDFEIEWTYLQEKWFHFLEEELAKITAFYSEKKAESARKLNTLKVWKTEIQY